MAQDRTVEKPYGAYHKRVVPAHDPELTETGPGTPMGECMRRFWQPVCMSEQLTDVPRAIRILGEDLVAFRDRSGRVGILQRHCSHRGTSLEFGIVQPRGIRCCYHGWVYDIDGRILELPAEPADSRIYDTVFQGAYPAFERDGLVFAYMGPPEAKPAFPEFDTYHRPEGNRLVPVMLVSPCNWLQVYENIMDHLHVGLLHNPGMMTVEGVDQATYAGLDYAAPMGFTEQPALSWEQTRDGNGMCFIACRRNDDGRTVWVRVLETLFPNYLQIGCTFPNVRRSRRSQTVWTRWHVPVDDTNMLIIGWRHFNDEIDPEHRGVEEKCGYEKLDFLPGVTGDRTYEEGQRAPGDYEALVSQRPIAIHALENPGASDAGVYMCRKLLRAFVRGEVRPHPSLDTGPDGQRRLHTYTQDSVIVAPREPGGDDMALMHRVGHQVLEINKEADGLPSAERETHVRRRFDEFDGGFQVAAE
jgi:phenylpropionate dioxygenase-like ring-hydroxylating dioxygenase large terminal subunit